jgi:hypothetical protein
MRIHRNIRFVLIAIACGGCESPPAVAPDLPAAGSGMPTIERRPFALAEADLPEERFITFDVGGDGRVVFSVHEDEAPKFRVVDSTGRRLEAFGRSGEGPGETRMVVRIDVRGDTVRLFETGRFMLVELNSSGRFLRERRVPTHGIALEWSADSVDHWNPYPVEGESDKAQVVYRSALGGTIGRRLVGPEDSILAAAALKRGNNAVLSIPYTSDRDRLWIADPWTYQIRLFNADGTQNVTFRPDIPAARMGPRQLRTVREQLARQPKFMRGPNGERITLPDESGRLDTLEREAIRHFSRNALHVDTHGRLWVIGLLRDSTSVDVFADTTWLGRAMLPCYASPYGTRAALGPGWLLLECEVDDSDWPTELQLYRVIEQE